MEVYKAKQRGESPGLCTGERDVNEARRARPSADTGCAQAFHWTGKFKLLHDSERFWPTWLSWRKWEDNQQVGRSTKGRLKVKVSQDQTARREGKRKEEEGKTGEKESKKWQVQINAALGDAESDFRTPVAVATGTQTCYSPRLGCP